MTSIPMFVFEYLQKAQTLVEDQVESFCTGKQKAHQLDAVACEVTGTREEH